MKSKSSKPQDIDIDKLKKFSNSELEAFAISVLGEMQKNQQISQTLAEKYQTLLTVDPNPVLVIDSNGYIRELNDKVNKHTGYSNEEILNKHVLKLPVFLLRDLPRYTLLFRQILKGELSVIEDIRWKNKKGELRYFNAFCKLFYNAQGKIGGFIAVVPDVTNFNKQEFLKNKAEKEYYDLIEKTQIALLTDDKQARITSANARFLNLFEYTEEEVKNLDLNKWVHPEDYSLVMKNHKNQLAGKKAQNNYEYRALTKSGKVIWCQVEVIPLLENGIKIGTRSYLWDISKRKDDEQKLEEQTMLLQSAIENLPDPFYVIDVKDYSIKLANSASGLKIGQKNIQLSNPKCFELTHHRETTCDGDEHPCPIEQLIKKRKPCTSEHIHYDIDGNSRNVEIRAFPILNKENQVIQIIEHAIDITDKKIANEILRKEKQLVQTYLDIAAVMLVALDTNQNIVLCNKEGLKILGYTESELIGKNWFDTVIPENERLKVKEVFEAFVAGKQNPPEYFENHIITKNREQRLIAWKNSFTRNREGNIENIISSGEDITWKRQSEEKLKKSEQKYHDLFDNHSASKLIVDIQTGDIRDCNKAATEFYGWSKNELKRMNIRQINLISDEEFQSTMKLANSNQQSHFEFKHRCAKGIFKDVEVYVGKVMVEDRECIHAIIHDITARKKSEMLLAQKYKLDTSLAKLFVPLSKDDISITEIAYAIYYEALALTNSTICYVATIDMENPNNLIAHTLSEILSDESCKVAQADKRKIVFKRSKDGKFPALLGHSLNQKESFFTNNTSQHPESIGVPEGHIKIDKFLSVPVLLNQELVGQIALANPEKDYTQHDLDTIEHLAEYMLLAIQRHRSSEKLRKSENRFKTVAETSGEWIWELDANGLFTYSSPVVVEINGFTAEELVGKMHYFDFYSKEIPQAKLQKTIDIFASMEGFRGVEDKIMHKDGREISIELKGIPVFSDKGKLKGYMGSTVNITEKKKAEADLLNHAKELEAFNRSMVDREIRIIEMKEEVNALCKSLNLDPRYPENWK